MCSRAEEASSPNAPAASAMTSAGGSSKAGRSSKSRTRVTTVVVLFHIRFGSPGQGGPQSRWAL